MTATPTCATCSDCGKPAPASAYGTALCLGHFTERGFNDPKLLGGRLPATTGERMRLVDVLGSEQAVVERLIEEFGASEITTRGGR